MTSVEDQVRAATRAQAAALREVRPLRLPPAASPGLGPASRARRSRAWIAPITAAAAVIALAVSLVSIRDIPNGRVVPPAGPVPAVAGVPRYYVTLYSPPQPATASPSPAAPCAASKSGQPVACASAGTTDLLVGDTFTGARLAVVTPPAGSFFSGVAAAADDRTFVVDATAMTLTGARTWYLLRIASGTSSPARLTRLAIPPLTGIDAIALSGSGRELAVALGLGNGSSEVRVYSVGTGRLLRLWSTKDPQALGINGYFAEQSRALAWIDGDHAVAFAASWLEEPTGLIKAAQALAREKGLTTVERAKKTAALEKRYGGPTSHMTWRRLDIAAAGGDLMADSTVIWSWASALKVPDLHSFTCQYGGIQLISADGKTVVCASVTLQQGTPGKAASWRVAWLAFSVPTGAVRTLYQLTVGAPQQPSPYGLWTGTSGRTLIVEWVPFSASSQAPPRHVGVISHGTFWQLPSPPDDGGAPSVTW
jgi:hypothetical protein